MDCEQQSLARSWEEIKLLAQRISFESPQNEESLRILYKAMEDVLKKALNENNEGLLCRESCLTPLCVLLESKLRQENDLIWALKWLQLLVSNSQEEDVEQLIFYEEFKRFVQCVQIKSIDEETNDNWIVLLRNIAHKAPDYFSQNIDMVEFIFYSESDNALQEASIREIIAIVSKREFVEKKVLERILVKRIMKIAQKALVLDSAASKAEFIKTEQHMASFRLELFFLRELCEVLPKALSDVILQQLKTEIFEPSLACILSQPSSLNVGLNTALFLLLELKNLFKDLCIERIQETLINFLQSRDENMLLLSLSLLSQTSLSSCSGLIQILIKKLEKSFPQRIVTCRAMYVLACKLSFVFTSELKVDELIKVFSFLRKEFRKLNVEEQKRCIYLLQIFRSPIQPLEGPCLITYWFDRTAVVPTDYLFFEEDSQNLEHLTLKLCIYPGLLQRQEIGIISLLHSFF